MKCPLDEMGLDEMSWIREWVPLPLARSNIAQLNYEATFALPPAQNYVKTMYKLPKTLFCGTLNGNW